jgi:hypothetical protein
VGVGIVATRQPPVKSREKHARRQQKYGRRSKKLTLSYPIFPACIFISQAFSS